MLVLALETSHEPGTIALLQDGICLEETRLSSAKRRGQTLVSELKQLFLRHNLSPRQTDLLAVGIGPGSFTGLRVGIVAAKTIAYICQAPVAAVPTLQTIVNNVPAEISQATVAIDAQRTELFLQTFHRTSDSLWEPLSEIRILPFDHWLETLSPDDVVLGPGLQPFQQQLTGRCRLLDESTWLPRASILARAALDPRFQAALWDVLPLYVRVSAAEETWNRRQNTSPDSANST
jgi:tRNA threonylcarbamoyladenosine biosynthesis protein TsaB